VFIGLSWVISPTAPRAIATPIAQNTTNTAALGLVLYTRYVYFFQAAGVVLLVAMIGAIVLTLRHKVNVKRQDISAQNARTAELAMTLRKVPSGQGLLDADAAEWVK
jgi:NADH-quinone oxidoreductase subunit J